jgi:hypothetical protein
MKNIRAARAGSPATTDSAVDRCNLRDPTQEPRWDACSADGHMAVAKRTRWRSVIEQSRNYDNGSAARLCDNGILVARRHRPVSPSLEVLSQWIPESPR